MKKIIVALSLIFVGALLQSCSSAKVRILPGEDGINKVVSRDRERDGAEEAAYKKARDFCEDQDKMFFLVKEEKTAYQGTMDEQKRKDIRNASKAAMVLSGPAGVLADNAAIGGAVAGAGTIGYSMTNDRDYTAEFQFRCK